MPRLLSTLLVVALLGGTAAAFAITQGLKITPSPILAPRVDKVFSPVCDCPSDVATIQFTLRKPDRVRLQVVAADGRVVRTLVDGRRLRGKVSFDWNGRDDQRAFVPEGLYHPRVHLTDQHRTIDLPNTMRVDTTPPKISLVSLSRTAISPDRDGHGEQVVIAYRTSEPAHGILLVDGKRIVYTRRQLERSSLAWNGRIAGQTATAGPHRLQLAAEDRAGNVSAPGRPFIVLVRYVTLSRDRIEAAAGTRFGVRVSADAGVDWKLGKVTGTAAPGRIVLRAPSRPGRYTLTVTVGAHSARAAVIVRRR